MTDSVRVSVRGKGATAEEEALVETAEDGRLSEMQRLLSEGVHVNAVNKLGTTALVRAATRNYTDCVDVLLKSGADVNAADRPPPHISDSYNGGWTALHHASYWGHVQVVQMLRDAAGSRLDESRRNDAGKTAADLVLEQALRAAAMADDEHEVSRLVVVLGVDPGAPDVKEGETPLLLAAAVHSWDSDRVSPALQLLLSKADQATIDHQDKWGRCALHVAVAQGKCGAVKALLQAGANPLLKDNAGKTPLEVAVAKKQWRCRNVLLTFKYKGHSLQEREEEREEEQQQQHKEEEEAKTPPQRRPVPAPEQHTKPSFTLLDRVDDLERQLKEVKLKLISTSIDLLRDDVVKASYVCTAGVTTFADLRRYIKRNADVMEALDVHPTRFDFCYERNGQTVNVEHEREAGLLVNVDVVRVVPRAHI